LSLRGPRGQVTAGNIAARVTGLLRVVAVGGALGTTYLGNTYQSANLVSNLLFELLAAGRMPSDWPGRFWAWPWLCWRR
jgi:peptidoglycan biosynthesis protein MviN/MurJ (putative lipid II flippase)